MAHSRSVIRRDETLHAARKVADYADRADGPLG
jgi:hypothetical protein